MEPTIPGKGYTNLAKLQAGEEQPLLLNTIQELNILEGEEVVEGSKGLLACLEVVQTCEASIGERMVVDTVSCQPVVSSWTPQEFLS